MVRVRVSVRVRVRVRLGYTMAICLVLATPSKPCVKYHTFLDLNLPDF